MVPPAPSWPPAGSVPRRPPTPALVAAPLALLSAMTLGLFTLIAWALSGGVVEGAGWLALLVPVVLMVTLLIGVVLLLTGRSWLVLALPAGALAALVLAGTLLGGWAGGTWFGLVTWLAPGAAAVLVSLPVVRRWVAARRDARRG